MSEEPKEKGQEDGTDAKESGVQLWVRVRCTDVNDQLQLAERFRLEGRAVKLTAASGSDYKKKDGDRTLIGPVRTHPERRVFPPRGRRRR